MKGVMRLGNLDVLRLRTAAVLGLMVLLCWMARGADGVHGYRDLDWFVRIEGKVVAWRVPADATNRVWILQSSADGKHWSDVATNSNAVFASPTNGLGFFRLKGVAQ